MGFVFVLALVLICILFLVFLILSIKTWRWLHVVACFFAFSMAITATIYMALVAKTVTAWKVVAQQNEERLIEVRDELRMIAQGSDTELTYAEGSKVRLKNRLARETIGLGRVWRNCTATQIGNNFATVTLSTVPPGTDPANYPGNQIGDGTTLYVFTEIRMDDDPNGEVYYLPQAYLGEFTVTAVDAQTVTLSLALPLGTNEEFQSANGRTWALYELMPIDRRDIFDDLLAGIDAPLINDPMSMSDEQLFERRSLIEERFPASFLSLDPNSEAYEAFIDRYAFDDLSFPRILDLISKQPNRINANFDPPPEETWVQVRFKDSGSFAVDVADDALTGTGLEGQSFNSQGQAIVRNLRQGFDSQWEEGDELIVDQFTAELGYVDGNGVNRDPLIPAQAEKVFNVYRRQLTDYEFFFHESALYSQLLDQDLARAARDNVSMAEAREDAGEQVKIRDDAVSKIAEDNRNFEQDLTLVTTRRSELEAQLADRMDRMNRLYAANLELAKQKEEVEAQLTSEINEKTREAMEAFSGDSK